MADFIATPDKTGKLEKKQPYDILYMDITN